MTDPLLATARVVSAFAIIYGCGYVTGALLVDPKHDRTSLSLGIVRMVAGLMLTAVAFLLSLKLAVPWFTGPIGLCALAVVVYRRTACVPPRPAFSFQWDDAVAGLLAAVVVAPVLVSVFRMAPGTFPPVFFNADTPYFLEKVHALVKTDIFPPESLSVLGGRRLYHFGANAMAAFVSRGSSVAPHHSLFFLVVPLLVAGTVASAWILARAIGSALPAMVSVPLLLIPVPTLWYDHWHALAPALQDMAASLSLDRVDALTRSWQMWSVPWLNAQNHAAQFLVLGSLAAIAIAQSIGWRLPLFLVGSAFVFKPPAGVALLAGFSLAQAWSAVGARSLRPLRPVVAAVAVFGGLYGAFWILSPIPGELRVVLSPLFLLEYMQGEDGTLLWFLLDVAWLFLPALVLLPAWRLDPDTRSLPLLVFALAPVMLLNLLRVEDIRRSFAGFAGSSLTEEDWRQIILPVPVLIHAFVLSVAGRRWVRLDSTLRAGFLAAVLLAVSLPVFVAVRYTHVLLFEPQNAHEFADNHAIGEALATIPTDGTVIVTNDLRYPAEEFDRANRQTQIPALFGHQAFAVDYVYEAYEFSEERMKLQKLLEAEQWSAAIEQAARAYGWTHLLVRNDYPHPQPIPLERQFDNGVYSVYRFPPSS